MRLRHFCLVILTSSFVYGKEPKLTRTVGSYKYDLYVQGKKLDKAISACKAKNAWLVEIQYEEIQKVVSSLINNYVLIGGKYGTVWKWGDESLMRYTNWASDQPKSNSDQTQIKNNKNCLVMNYRKTYEWKNIDCSGSPQHYICQSYIENYTSCVDEVCSNRGNCEFTDQRYICSCDEGYFGTKCEKRIIEISSISNTYEAKRGQTITKEFKIVSYDGNVDVKGGKASVSTSSITSNRVEENVTISFGPIVSMENSVTYIIEATSKKTSTISTKMNITVRVETLCKSKPCVNGADCEDIPGPPYFECSCKPAFEGSNCNEPKYRYLNNCKYHVNYDQKLQFKNASSTCDNIGGSLAMLKSSAIQDFVEDQVITQYSTGNTIEFWIGGTIHTNSWYWLDNTSISSTATSDAMWASSNEYSIQNNLGGFLILSSLDDSTRRNMTWFSKSSDKQYGYVCEVPENSPCNSLQCENQGTCVAVGCQASCNCAPGYLGTNCEIDVFTIAATTHNFTSMIGQNITVTLNISSYEDSVEIDVFKTTTGSKASYTKQNVRNAVNITIGPFIDQSFGTKYLFKATPQTNPGIFYKHTSISVIVQGPARIKSIEPRSLAVPHEKKNYSIKCEATGVPLPTVQWFKEGNLVTNNTDENIYQVRYFGNASLFVKKDARMKLGNYICQGYNVVNGTKMTSNDTAFLQGKIQLISSTITDDPVTGSVSITCIYEGYPVPTVQWKWFRYYNALEITAKEIFSVKSKESLTSGFSSKTSTLNIRLAEYLGTTKFACSARNIYENTTYDDIEINKNLVLNRNNAFRFFNFSKKRRYSEAQNYCRNMQSNLTKITDSETQNILAQAATKLRISDKIYIGAQKHLEDGSYIWRWYDQDFLYNETKQKTWNGTPAANVDGSYISWKANRSAAFGKCLAMISSNWKWTDSDCLAVEKFICEKLVAGIPRLITITIDECSSNVTIRWRAASESIGIPHRIDVEELDKNLTKVHTEIITPKNSGEKIEKITNLKHWTSYIVNITVCPELCSHPATMTKTLTTHASIPGPVSSANVTQINKTCLITWEMNYVPGITGFTISAASTVIHDESGTYFEQKFEEKREVANSTNHVFKYTYNRKYTFSIQAQTCAGAGPPREVTGHCVTHTGPPDKVLSPKVAHQTNADDTVDITIPFPDEINGPIRCLFVIVIFMPNQSVEEMITNLEDLEAAMTKNASESLTENDAYIAFAISRSDISKEMIENKNFTRKLGDGSLSACNLTETKTTRRKKRETSPTASIQAKNLKLKNDATYSYYTLSATPGEDGAMYYKTSNISYFKKLGYQSQNDDPKLSSSTVIAIVVVIIVILVAILAVCIWLRKRHSKVSKLPDALPMTDTRTQAASEPEYANLAMDNEIKSETDIPLTRLLEVYNFLRADDSAKFYDQFEKLKQTAITLDYPTLIASAEALRRKNRYKNILPSDHTRVVLRGEEDSSYINACYVNGFGKTKKYIATQGPLPATVADFWRMIFEQKVQVITMLAKCKENGRKKCEKYWPDLGFSKQYGNITVINAEEITYGSHKLRTLRVMKDGEESTVHQMQFLDWPDHGVPVTTTSLIGFCASVAEIKSNRPVVVHCSAGAGRTGAFIAYNNLLGESESLNSIDVYRCVLALRKQRVDMVQTCEQYMLVHKLILEHYLYGVTEMDPIEIKNMDERNLNVTLQKHYANLSIIGPINQIKHGFGEKVSAMNRNSDIVPYESNHIVITRLQEDTDPPYINASTVQTYANAFKLIAAQGPMKNTVEFFWRAIIDNNVNTIIMLSKCNKGQCYQYWPEKEYTDIKVGNITIHLRKEDAEEAIVRRELLIKRKDDEMTIIQFQYSDWSSNECPKSASLVIEMIAKMQSSLQRDKDASAIIHCSDGAGRTGAFCAIVNLIERLKRESKIDLFRAVKDLRDCRPGMVQTLDQYRYCFKAVSEYLAMFSPYSKLDEDDEGQSDENPYVTVV